MILLVCNILINFNYLINLFLILNYYYYCVLEEDYSGSNSRAESPEENCDTEAKLLTLALTYFKQ